MHKHNFGQFWGGGGEGGEKQHLYTKELAISIPMHTYRFLGKRIDIGDCFDCLPC